MSTVRGLAPAAVPSGVRALAPVSPLWWVSAPSRGVAAAALVLHAQADQLLDRAGVDVADDHGDEHRVAGRFRVG
jgi:hypothetical protein